MKRLFVTIGLIGLVVLSAMGQKKREVMTPTAVSYVLPRVEYDVVVTMECVELIPGPLCRYAEEELGERPEIETAGQQWRVKTIRLEPRSVPDKNAMFSVGASGTYGAVALNLTPEGFLAGVGGVYRAGESGKKNEAVYKEEKRPVVKEASYVDFGVRSTKKEVLDSNFTMVEYEGEMRRQWDPIIRYELKDEADYASECAREIFNIRQKRLEAIATVNQAALDELERLEADYMSLFMGKRISRKVVKRFTFAPEKADDSILLFRFSESKGITTKNNVAAQPYIVEVRNVVVVDTKNGNGGQGNAAGSGITYRVPAVADLVLMKGDEEVLSVRAVLPQLGYFATFPTDVIDNEGIYMEFYPEYGSLKGIGRK